MSVAASSERKGSEARLATDGRLDTRWVAARPTYPQWLRVDLGQSALVAEVRVAWYMASTRAYTHSIQVSADGVHWGPFSAGATARFVRVWVTGCSAPHASASIRELRIFGWQLPTALQLHDVHGLRFTGVTFDGRGSGYGGTSGVIEITGKCYNIVFSNCTFMTNRDAIGNGVKIMNINDSMHDITFSGCHFMNQPRMGFECIDRSRVNGAGYRRISLIKCTFEPQDSQAISYDDNSGLSGDCLIQGNVVKGGGVSATTSWGAGFEINRVHRMRVIGNTFYACRDSVWNLTGPSGECGWTFLRNTVDSSQIFGGIRMRKTANCVTATGITAGVFAGNMITDAPPSTSVAYFAHCRNMDWRTTTWMDARGPSYTTPQQVDCSGNRF